MILSHHLNLNVCHLGNDSDLMVKMSESGLGLTYSLGQYLTNATQDYYGILMGE